MEVSDTLKAAWSAVESAELPEKIHEVAFREAVRLIAPIQYGAAVGGGLLQPAGYDAGVRRTAPEASGDGTIPEVSEREIYDRVATNAGVDRDLLEQLVHLDGDAIKISVAGLKLGRNNAERTRAVAQILAVCRGFGFEETDTSLEVIRAECDRLKVYDRDNFSSQIKALNGYVITGSGNSRRLRARGAGIEAFPTLVGTIVGVA